MTTAPIPFKPLLLDLLRQAQADQNAFFARLAPAELATDGTPDLWAAKDHVAHMTFWRKRLTLRLRAIIQREPQPDAREWQEMNPIVFEEHRHDAWPALLAASDHAYDELIAVATRLSDEDLTASQRFPEVNDGQPLYLAFMGNCYEHTQTHLAQYLSDRHDPTGALDVYERWARRIADAEMPAMLRGYVLYNLACYYATHERVEQARAPLRQAFALAPATREFARTDPDLVALRSESAE